MIPRFVRLAFAAALALPFAGLRAQPPAPAATTASAASAELVSVNMPDGDLDGVLGALEQLSGRVVLRAAQLPTAQYRIPIKEKVPRAEAITAILTVLSLNNIGITPQGEKFFIATSLNQTKMSAPELLTGSAYEQAPSGKTVTKIFQLDFLRVNEFAGLITGILNPTFGQPVQLPNANALLVTDSVTNVQRVETILQAVDKPSAAGLKPKFYTLHNGAKASDVVGKIRTILGGPALTQQIGSATSYSADDRANQIIVVTDPRQYPLFDELITRLDVKSDPNTRNEVINLKHAEATKVASLLTTVVNGQNSAAQKGGNQSVRPGTGAAGATPTPVPAAPVAPTVTLPGLEGLAGANEFSNLVTINPDERSNSVVVSGTIDDIRLLKALIEKLDVILAQVRIEVVIAEVTLDDNHTSGISQLGLKIDGDKLVGFSGALSGLAIASGVVSRAATVRGGFDLAGDINMGISPRKNNTSIISTPTITTSHAKEATFFSGETRPVVSGVTSTPTAGSTTTGFSTSSQVNQQEIGITLTVKPLIGNDGSVQLEITQKVDDVAGTIKVDNNDQPIIARRNTKS
ncbi:MAG: hypothetical protein RLZZ15_4383, partial [Verrucomicrobiota bacterium]